jgi:hypothetical protein
MKLVINNCYGGFSLSREAVLLARSLTDDPAWREVYIKGDRYPDGVIVDYDYGYIHDSIQRDDPILVQVVEQLGSEKASGNCAELVVEELSKGTVFRIKEHDGWERIEVSNLFYNWKVAT